jgi:Xaa-Pro aminopeptidase
MRIDRLREKVKNMLVTNPVNVKYLSGFTGEGFLIVTPEKALLVTDPRYIEQAKKETTNIEILNILDIKLDEFYCQFPELGFEENFMTFAKYKRIKTNLIETNGVIEELRSIKDNFEIEKIKRVCELGDKCFDYICKFIKTGMTERQIAFEIDSYMMKNGASKMAFDTIVASGENSSMPHAVTTDRVIKQDDIIQFDFGAELDGYCGDMSRVIFVNSIKDEYRKIYDLVLEAQNTAISNLNVGMMGKEADFLARNIIKNNGYDFGHSLGHGIGLEAHELPRLSPSSDLILKENMVFSIEPGVYLEGNFGVRIEDLILLSKNGFEVLSKSSKEHIII